MSDFRIENIRGGLVESTHRVSVSVCDADGALRAVSGNPDRITIMRSSAKPFQAIPLVEDGVVQRYQISREELALACASHSSERRQVEIVAAWLARIGYVETDLACGPHRPLSRELAVQDFDAPVEQDPLPPSPVTSNCSGKHTGMLALAKHHGWDIAGYNTPDHPVQRRIMKEIVRYMGIEVTEIATATDGCGVVTFAVPLHAMAAAFARMAASAAAAPRAIVGAMVTHPDLVGGVGRLCTAVMQAYPRRVLAKVGAEGVYGGALLDEGLGIALKVEDGNARAATVALVAVLEQLGLEPKPSRELGRFAQLPILNTRREHVGMMQPAGTVSFV